MLRSSHLLPGGRQRLDLPMDDVITISGNTQRGKLQLIRQRILAF